MKNSGMTPFFAVLSLAAVLSLTSCTSSVISGINSATVDSAPVVQAANESIEVNTSKLGDHVITPQDTKKVLNKSLGNTDMSERFYIDPGYGYARVYVYNDGKAPINITVTQESASGPVKMKGKINPR
ncbi:hypothetical protein MMB75_05185 [Paenibacillus sp. P2(2022)]|uniref:hypothetical protein n=1 Tax=Paenibacillus TaxID=44249 RepID=UPI0003764A5F|nr:MULTISPECIES: hypothetical protein [Paenibacillus]MDG0053066.1 hypothetical protein [Paenibacillus sp. P2(2022)]